jgi:hypothetical protein
MAALESNANPRLQAKIAAAKGALAPYAMAL